MSTLTGRSRCRLALWAIAFAAIFSLVASETVRAEESRAKPWGLSEEEPARIDGRVVDVLCELTGDCPDACGGGARQLGLLKPDASLVLVAKNGQPAFSGAAVDLAPYCGLAVEADGLMTGHSGQRFYQVQFIREAGAVEWSKADRWTKARAASDPPLREGKGPWFRRDPRVLERIERDGYLGLGLEEDARFIADW